VGERLNIYIPDDLERALQAHRDQINVSRVCQAALAQEVARLERVDQVDAPLPRLTEEQRVSIATRIRQERDRQETFWYSLGYRTAFEWACNRAEASALEVIAGGGMLRAEAAPGWIAGQEVQGPPLADAVRAWDALHKAALETAERQADAPQQNLPAFNRGVHDGAQAVWEAVGPDVTGGQGADPA